MEAGAEVNAGVVVDGVLKGNAEDDVELDVEGASGLDDEPRKDESAFAVLVAVGGVSKLV